MARVKAADSVAPSGAGFDPRREPTANAVGYRLSVLRTSCPTVPGPAVRLTHTPNAANHPAAASGPEGRKRENIPFRCAGGAADGRIKA